MLKINPLEDFSSDIVYKHTIQGFIYSAIKESGYLDFHDIPRFKFFCFSDIFPSGDFREGKIKNLIISSPDKNLISSIYDFINKRLDIPFRFNNFQIGIAELKMFDLSSKNKFISGSPIVLYRDNFNDIYFSFRRDKDMDFFLGRLKENALKKYNAYYGDEFDFEGPIFDNLEFKKEVAVRNFKKGKEFIIIGNVWSFLEKRDIKGEKNKFYKFIMDCGLGEKNSMGFGFINPIK